MTYYVSSGTLNLTKPKPKPFTLGPLCRALEAVAWSCIIVTLWSGAVGIQALSARPTGFLQFFDTWFGHMTYKNRPRYDL